MIKLAKKFRKGKKKVQRDEIVNIKRQTYWKKPENVREDEIILERKEGKVKVLKERVPYERKQTYWIKKREQEKGVKKEKEQQQLSLNASIPVVKTNALSKVLNSAQLAKAKEKYGEETVNTLLRIMAKRDQYEKGSFFWWKWQKIGEKYIRQIQEGKVKEPFKKTRETVIGPNGKEHRIYEIKPGKDHQTNKKTAVITQIIRDANLKPELKRHTVIREDEKIIHNGVSYEKIIKKKELENPHLEKNNEKEDKKENKK